MNIDYFGVATYDFELQRYNFFQKMQFFAGLFLKSLDGFPPRLLKYKA